MPYWLTCASAAKASNRGLIHARQNQADIECRYRSFLYDDEKQEEHARKDGDQEVRSRRTQACDVQGRQDQISVQG